VDSIARVVNTPAKLVGDVRAARRTIAPYGVLSSTSTTMTCCVVVAMLNVARAGVSSSTPAAVTPSGNCGSLVRVSVSVNPAAIWKPAIGSNCVRSAIDATDACSGSEVAPAGMSIVTLSSPGTLPPSALMSVPRSMRPG